jgi:long-chain fatty acid transport protein
MKFSRVFALMALAGLATSAQATDGYFSHGYGMKAKGMGGAATATSEDGFAGANNPAAAAFAGSQLDIGLDLFSPKREASRTGSAGGAGFFDGTAKSNSDYFLIPEFAYNKMVSSDLALGVSVYGNGGLNTNYPTGQSDLSACGGNPPSGSKTGNLFCGPGKLGVNLTQLIIAPTAAYKISPDHAIGISPLIGYQRFKAYGLQAFTPASSSPSNVTDNGFDDSFGYGVRIGYQGHLTSTLSIGAAYASKMNFEKFSKYKGLFANQGEFDIPENYNVGVAWQATPMLLVAVDYQRINFSGVDSVGNSSSIAKQFGSSGGPGFGWSDADVWKLGVEYKYDKAWTLRAGYNHADSPIQSADAAINILAPAVVEDHLTLGFTYAFATGNELTLSYLHAFDNKVSGTDPNFGGTDTLRMYQNSIGVAYSWKM